MWHSEELSSVCPLIVLLLKTYRCHLQTCTVRPGFSSIRASIYSVASGERALLLPLEVQTFSALGCVPGSFRFSLPPFSFIWIFCFFLVGDGFPFRTPAALGELFLSCFVLARSSCLCLSRFPSTPCIFCERKQRLVFPFACMAPVSGVSVNSKIGVGSGGIPRVFEFNKSSYWCGVPRVSEFSGFLFPSMCCCSTNPRRHIYGGVGRGSEGLHSKKTHVKGTKRTRLGL